MSNLLPQNARRHLAQQVIARIVIVASLALGSAGGVGLVSLAPAYTSATLPRRALENMPQSEQMSATSTVDRDTVSRFKLLVKEMHRLTEERSSIAHALALLEDLRPKGVTLENVYYRAGAPGTLVVSGSVSRRDLVGEYRTVLEKTGYFKNIAVPVASLVGTSAGSFTLTITGTF